ncbi:6-aminopenicillanic acid acyl-transferase [Nonomuraea sp. FMUSA5-5]|uniref:6-aminopenicillanic acid acyl-transferase n=1 Tax=Nonomuraea composti TaxID=2720023 RepID=A0ABX1BEC5_9ACTN|nr:C45 family peptidase [Nonomuraea sp. FMUSA5-5]NJP96100.1 6-aminopenicillanic acid acyl-transferase [Nonomuraea sp. FMUSA5-5]
MTVIECAGTHLDMGRAHGEQARAKVRRALEVWRESTARSTAELVTGSPLLGTVRRLLPGLADELRGIAEGAGVPFADVVAYNWMDEAWWMRRRHLRRHGCSVVGACRGGSGSRLAQNMDLPAFMDGSQLVLRLRPRDAPEQLVLTSAGMLALTGVNAAGVAVCVNTLGMLNGDPHGLPVAAVIRGALAHRDRAGAAAFVRGVPHASGQHYAVGDGGGIESLECSAGGAVPVPLREGRLVHTNHALASADLDEGALRELRERGSVRDSQARLSFLDAAWRAEGSAAEAEELLTDDTVPICVPGVPEWPIRTFGSVSYRLGQAPRARFRLGLPEVAGWVEPGWRTV